jgi:CheY-like chemotaxis protein/nitrogen-specific signal transduction histidine kinase
MLALAHEKRERELAEAKLRAEQSSEQKTTFLANMSHEIRTPMNSILGFSELLAGDIRDPRQRQYLDSLRASAKSLLQLINDVLDMSKIEAGVMQLRPEPTDPREICEFVETVFLEQATRKGLELRCSVAEDLPRGLLLDRTRIRQILVNLVGNAVKFTEAGHVRVAVDWDRSQGRGSRIELVIQVSDTGCGVPREQLAAIFEPFVQSDPRRGQEREGTGLGLAIVKRLTEVMGGTILVSSEVDRGTRFELRIPDVVVSAKLPISEQSSPEATLDFNEMRPSRVLVADDNKANRDLLAGIFDGSHHQIFFAEDGEQAVTIAQEEKPDLILMDVRMPKLDGYGALEALRSTPGLERTPVIAVTASGLASDEKVIRRAFSGYLRKPFTRRALYNELAQFLPRRETSREAQEARSANGRPENGEPTPARWAELAARLREAEAKEWPAVKDGLSVTEVRQFAERLGVMGRQAGYPPLVAYAEDLLGHCESYAVPEMEQALEAFPGAIRDLERSAS